MNNPLIYGANQEQEIVSVEVENGTLYKFFNNGLSTQEEYKYWFLTDRPGQNSLQLEGDLQFKYFNEYENYDEYKEAKNNAYKKVSVFNVADPAEQALMLQGITLFKGLRVEDVSVWGFDIEANGLITDDLRTPVVGENAEVYIIANTIRKNGETIRKMFSLDEYDNQYEMIEEWCEWVRENDPTIVAAHNGFSYDLAYLNYVWERQTGYNLPLGRLGRNIKFDERTSKFRKDGSQSYDFHDVKCFGRQIIDTMFLAIKYDFKRDYVSYGLKQIIKQEGLEIEDRQHYDASKIAQNWYIPEEREKIKKYAEQDGDDAIALYDLMIPSFFYYTQSIPMNFQRINNTATGTQINKLLVRSYLQEGHSIPNKSDTAGFEGAISFGNPGFYENVRKVDVASLYPSIMRTYKIYSKQKDPKKNFLNMVDYFTVERLENKRLGRETGDRYYKDMEQAQKIVINSAYGMLGAKGLQFNYPEGAAFVTEKGRDILQTGVKWASGQHFVKVPKLTKTGKIKKKTKSEEPQMEWKLDGEITGKYRIVNVDTDSFSYTNGEAPIEGEFEQEIEEINSLYPDGIVWEDDGVFKKVIVVKAKNYILDNGKKIKYKGSGILDQKKEPALKEMLEKLVNAILDKEHDDTLTQIYESYIHEAMTVQDISRWVTKKTVSKAVLEGERKNETKVFDALQGRTVQEGDKIWVFQDIDGVEPVMVKGEVQYYKKTGEMKTKPRTVLRMLEDFTGTYDKGHFVKRVYATLCILDNVLDMNLFVDYTKTKAYNQLLERYNEGN